MAARRAFLLEVGCEEIPAPMLPAALADLAARLLEALGGPEGLGGTCESPAIYGGPRRLVAYISDIKAREEDREVMVSGPSVQAAFGPEGSPTKAAAGFAKAQGVAVDSLQRIRGEKGEVVAARKKIIGRDAASVLAEACPAILAAMRFPKMMKWGDQGFFFVRPVHWIAALLDDEVIPFSFVGVSSGRSTQGHRFLSPGPHAIPRAADYERVVSGAGKVLPRPEMRRSRIVEACDKAAAAAGWSVRRDPALLEELTFLTEHPSAVAGSFAAEHLDLPEAVLVTAMRHHQKYFPVQGKDGRLAAGFAAVIDTESDRDGVIRRGHEWVLRARLHDAQFFWKEDRRRTLADRLADLARITFHESLGSVQARVERLQAMAELVGGNKELRQAARLCKADLTTGMVGEFPELQGIMGGIYARAEGLPASVAEAIEQHYLPTSPEGPLPAAPLACDLAVLDKIDLLAGCFAVGLIPKGSADPHGLRRAAAGICRITASRAAGSDSPPVSLAAWSGFAFELYRKQGIAVAPEARENLLQFVAQRMRFLLEEQGVRVDTARAVLSAGADNARDVWSRAEALSELRSAADEGDFLALAASAKRIRNILAQARDKGIHHDSAGVSPKLLRESEEKDLHGALDRVGSQVEKEIAKGTYKPALRAIASLRPQVDRFFDKVLVMAPEADLRANRLALLESLAALLRRVADFSEIVVEGETADKMPQGGMRSA